MVIKLVLELVYELLFFVVELLLTLSNIRDFTANLLSGTLDLVDFVLIDSDDRLNIKTAFITLKLAELIVCGAEKLCQLVASRIRININRRILAVDLASRRLTGSSKSTKFRQRSSVVNIDANA